MKIRPLVRNSCVALAACALALGGLTPTASATEKIGVDQLAASTYADDEAAVDPADIVAALAAANEALNSLGGQAFLWPSVALFCSASDEVPLGIVPAAAGAVPGPWPGLPTIPGYTIPGIPGVTEDIVVPEIDLNPVADGDTLWAFVPAGIVNDAGNTGGMYVAWFNVATFQGGFAELGSPGDVLINEILDRVLAPLAGVPGFDTIAGIIRNSIVDTLTAFVDENLGSAGTRVGVSNTGADGTVLAVMFGSITHTAVDGTEKTCYFIPTVGIIDTAKAGLNIGS